MKSRQHCSESESSSDDENLAHLREAADTDFINDGMFQVAGDNRPVEKEKDQWSKPEFAPKSQRNVADDNTHIDDQLIPEEVQKFVSKKLAKIIENRVEFVDVCGGQEANGRTDKTVEEIKLLDDVVLNIDWTDSKTTERCKRNKTEIKKRKLPDVDDSKTESVRIREAVIDFEYVSKEVSKWRTRPKGTLFEYYDKNGRLFEVQPNNEFSEIRKSNNWDESRISRNKNWSK